MDKNFLSKRMIANIREKNRQNNLKKAFANLKNIIFKENINYYYKYNISKTAILEESLKLIMNIEKKIVFTENENSFLKFINSEYSKTPGTLLEKSFPNPDK